MVAFGQSSFVGPHMLMVVLLFIMLAMETECMAT